MNSKKIYYIGFYKNNSNKLTRNYSLAAVAKMDYLSKVLTMNGYQVEIISASWVIDSMHCFEKGYKEVISQNIVLKTFSSFCSKSWILRRLRIIHTFTLLFCYLLKLKKTDIVLVYHSPWLALPLYLAKKLKRFSIILEVEEIYSDISSLGKIFDMMENIIIKISNKYILSNDLLCDILKIHNKPNIVLYGNYLTKDTFLNAPDKNKIYLLYAGIVDLSKAGAFNAINASLYLDSNYELHIIGFGDIDKLNEEIIRVNKINNCKIFYDGMLYGDEYIKYCQKFHIALATQRMHGKYLDSSFPSKIISYLSMGLNVVSGEIKCVKYSQISHLINYYNTDNPKSIAESIKSAKLHSRSDITSYIKSLHNEFSHKLIKLIES